MSFQENLKSCIHTMVRAGRSEEEIVSTLRPIAEEYRATIVACANKLHGARDRQLTKLDAKLRQLGGSDDARKYEAAVFRQVSDRDIARCLQELFCE